MKNPKLIFSDFDGTLTLGNDFRKEFLLILELLKKKEIPLVICTGRSKSWAHFLLSHFPTLTDIISEGGGVLSSIKYDKNGAHRILSDQLLIEKSEVKRLEKTTEDLLKKFPSLKLSTDSFGRETDRAIELSDLNKAPSLKENIKSFFSKKKVSYSTSNIHLNFWCGEVSKKKAIHYYISQKKYIKKDEILFFGDSLNDESVFKDLPHTIGVSNIQEVLPQLKFPPQIILEGKENAGPLGVYNYLKSNL